MTKNILKITTILCSLAALPGTLLATAAPTEKTIAEGSGSNGNMHISTDTTTEDDTTTKSVTGTVHTANGEITKTVSVSDNGTTEDSTVTKTVTATEAYDPTTMESPASETKSIEVDAKVAAAKKLSSKEKTKKPIKKAKTAQ